MPVLHEKREGHKHEAPAREDGDEPLFLVVGFNGSAASVAALRAASQMIKGRAGHLEVVFVERPPITAACSPTAYVGAQQSVAAQGHQLDQHVRHMLEDREPRWQFRRRRGNVARELEATVQALKTLHGAASRVILVVGAARPTPLHRVQSVPLSLTRHGLVPLVQVA